MREIKFRAWDKEQKQMLTIAGVIDTDEKFGGTVYNARNKQGFRRSYALSICESEPEEWGHPDDLIWMQYTGMKDKKGVEIYEGDIVENTTQTVYLGDKYEVVWNKNYAGYQLMSNGFTSNIPLIQNFMSYEVIGNIFENPELLGEQQK